MELVVNEWLPEYFKPNATIDEKRKLESFLNKFMERNDKIFVRRPSEFLNKIYRYAKEFQYNIKTTTEIRKFIKAIVLDSNKCLFVDENEFKLPEETRKRLIDGGNTISDIYLFEAASATETKLVITTDAKLKTLMEDDTSFNVELLDIFLDNY